MGGAGDGDDPGRGGAEGPAGPRAAVSDARDVPASGPSRGAPLVPAPSLAAAALGTYGRAAGSAAGRRPRATSRGAGGGRRPSGPNPYAPRAGRVARRKTSPPRRGPAPAPLLGQSQARRGLATPP